MNILKKMVNKVKKLFKKEEVKKEIHNSDKLYIDIGSSSIKASYKNEYINFRSSIRKITNTNELTIAKNIIFVDGCYFVIGENNTSIQNVDYKCDKENLNVLVLYAVKLLNEKCNLDLKNIIIDTMLPFNQLNTVDKLKRSINGTYVIKDLQGFNEEVSINVNNVKCEGETSYIYFEEKCREFENSIILNIGNSTIDIIAMDNMQNARQELATINQGTNLLISSFMKYITRVPNSSLLSSFMKGNKFKFTNEEIKNIHQEKINHMNTIMFDLESVIKKCNPYSTNIIVTGGGAMLLHDVIKEIFKNYNIILPNKSDCLYSDLMGLKILSNDNDNIVASDIQEFIISKQEPTTNYEKCKFMIDEGMNLKEISEKLQLEYTTIRNYSCRYNKEKQMAA